MKGLVNHFLKRFNGDAKFAKKVAANNAILAHEEGDLEDFELYAELSQSLEVVAANASA